MSQIAWSGVDGDWSTAADWVGGVGPTAADDAVIQTPGTYTVTVTSAEAANSLTLNDPGATLAIGNGGDLTVGTTLNLSSGALDLNSGGVISGGKISDPTSNLVADGGILAGVTYEGTLNMSAAGATLYVQPLVAGGTGLALEGAGGVGNGAINLTGDGSELQCVGTQTLDNATINIGGSNQAAFFGTGDLPGASTVLTLGSGLVINQTGALATIIDSGHAGDSVINKGAINATLAGGELFIDTRSFTNEGAITVSNGESLTINNAMQSATGTLTTNANSEVFLSNGASLSIQGTLQNAGRVLFNALGSTTAIRVMAGGLSLAGGGAVGMEGTGARILGLASSDVLTNVDNTISGSGLIGQGKMTLVNDAAGVIDAVGSGDLVVDTEGKTLTNLGLLEASSTGQLVIEDTTVNNVGGTIQAGSGAAVKLRDDVVQGGAVGSAGTGVVDVITAGGEFDGSTSAVTLSGLIQVLNGQNLILNGAIDNTGELHILEKTSDTDLIIGGAGATLSGGGQVSLSADYGGQIYGQAPSDVLTNVDNTIFGSGSIGMGRMTLINEAAGVIDGDRSQQLVINTGGNTIQNAGLIENTGGLTVVRSPIDNTGTFEVDAGKLVLTGPVTGSGVTQIKGGTFYVNYAFAEAVSFLGSRGRLRLGDSQAFTGTVSNLSTTGTDSLDLADIAFKRGVTTASYSGTTTSGVLTVTDGTHTARITLEGDYTNSTFEVSSDGSGGTTVIDPTANHPGVGSSQAVHAFAQAMAGIGTQGHAASPILNVSQAATPAMLATPGVHGI